jgi:hypothetical protein
MPDAAVAPHAPFPYDPGLDRRVSRVETALVEIKAMLAASLPHLASRAELAQLRGDLRTDLGEKPGKLYMWGILAVLVAAYAAGLAVLK